MVLFRWRNRWEPHRFGSITTVYWDSQETQSSPTHRKKLQGILLTHDLPFFFPCEMSEWQRCSRLGDLGVYCSRKRLSLRSQKCHFMCFCFSLHKISGVIGKAQCLWEKNGKKSVTIKEVTSKARDVYPSDGQTLLQCHQYHHPCAYVQNCKRAQSLGYGIIKG